MWCRVFAWLMWCACAGVLCAGTKPALVTVPFVGCASDGQGGPQPSPEGAPVRLQVPAAVAERLAYYAVGVGWGVLGPRGWHCFGTYGSSGAALHLSSTPIDTSGIFTKEWRRFSGPALEISTWDGSTSGRYEVAEAVARLFPSARGLTRRAEWEATQMLGLAMPRGPFPADKLTYRGKRLVEFTTPPGQEGLGRKSRLLDNGEPVHGFVMLGTHRECKTPYILQLTFRLPAGMQDLAPYLIRDAEKRARE